MTVSERAFPANLREKLAQRKLPTETPEKPSDTGDVARRLVSYMVEADQVLEDVERAFRETVDFKAGVGFNPDSGMINDRGDFHRHEATDGQAGTILRAYREHLMSEDDSFLRRLWPNIRKAVEFLMAKDPDKNGLLEGKQPHTLDAAWHGPMGWLSGLYLASLAAGEAEERAQGRQGASLGLLAGITSRQGGDKRPHSEGVDVERPARRRRPAPGGVPA